MSSECKYIAIAITRTCGSGGKTIGSRLADAYGIDWYDRDLLRLAAEDSGISEKLFANADENTRKTILYRASSHVYSGEIIPPESGNFLSDQNLFNYQAKVLRELLENESYVCIGRAADFVLRDRPNVVTIFLNAPYEYRVDYEVKRQGIPRGDAEQYIRRLDDYRNAYYVYHTGRQWKDPENYDLCLNTAALGIDGCVDLIRKYILLRFGTEEIRNGKEG